MTELPQPFTDSVGECPEWVIGEVAVYDGAVANAAVWIDDPRDDYPIHVKGDGIFKPDEARALAAALFAAAAEAAK